MHSRIFQVSSKPIEKHDYITESDYYDHWFTHEIADYVNGNTERDYDIDWLANYCKGFSFERDENGEYFIIEDKGLYFSNAFENFKQALEKIGNPTLDEFVNGIDLWNLKNSYEDKFSFYIECADCEYGSELMSLDTFVRISNVGEKYYLGGTVDYHW